MSAPKSKRKRMTETDAKRSFETFRQIGSFEESNLKSDYPSAFNGIVRVQKYRITIEPVKEPIEVLRARVQKLWDECDNHHHRDPLQSMAKELGMERLEWK